MKKSSINILLVEDDRDLAASVADYLLLENIICDHAYHGKAGLSLASENFYDVIILDIMLPQLDGLHVCEALRRNGSDTPILMLTAMDTLDEKLTGFAAGADDYLVKPFPMPELVARVKALSNRRSGQAKTLQTDNLVLDLEKHQATRGGQTLHLSPTTWKLLVCLMKASPKMMHRAELSQAVWGDSPPNSDSLKVHLHHLRQQVDKPGYKKLLHTIPHQGIVIKDDYA